jgi:hypothetical protein
VLANDILKSGAQQSHRPTVPDDLHEFLPDDSLESIKSFYVKSNPHMELLTLISLINQDVSLLDRVLASKDPDSYLLVPDLLRFYLKTGNTKNIQRILSFPNLVDWLDDHHYPNSIYVMDRLEMTNLVQSTLRHGSLDFVEDVASARILSSYMLDAISQLYKYHDVHLSLFTATLLRILKWASVTGQSDIVESLLQRRWLQIVLRPRIALAAAVEGRQLQLASRLLAMETVPMESLEDSLYIVAINDIPEMIDILATQASLNVEVSFRNTLTIAYGLSVVFGHSETVQKLHHHFFSGQDASLVSKEALSFIQDKDLLVTLLRRISSLGNYVAFELLLSSPLVKFPNWITSYSMNRFFHTALGEGQTVFAYQFLQRKYASYKVQLPPLFDIVSDMRQALIFRVPLVFKFLGKIAMETSDSKTFDIGSLLSDAIERRADHSALWILSQSKMSVENYRATFELASKYNRPRILQRLLALTPAGFDQKALSLMFRWSLRSAVSARAFKSIAYLLFGAIPLPNEVKLSHSELVHLVPVSSGDSLILLFEGAKVLMKDDVLDKTLKEVLRRYPKSITALAHDGYLFRTMSEASLGSFLEAVAMKDGSSLCDEVSKSELLEKVSRSSLNRIYRLALGKGHEITATRILGNDRLRVQLDQGQIVNDIALALQVE